MLLAGTILAGCAEMPKRPTHKRLPQKRTAPKEVIRPAEAPAAAAAAQAATPKRHASMRLVEKGNAMLEAQEYDRATTFFRDAINVDGTNGVAYYSLALTRARQDEGDAALGLLDKAEALLGADPEWMTRIAELRAEIGGEPSPFAPTPIDDAF